MFCSAHSFSMACDSLYAAWLKVHYPYELYITMLKLYDEKKNTDKISAIIAEMKRYKNISLTAGRFGQDNRDWVVDKENHTISQSLSSIRYMSKQASKDLWKLGELMKVEIEGTNFDKWQDLLYKINDDESIFRNYGYPSFKTFTDALRSIQMYSCLDTRQIKILIELGYFSDYGGSGKLMKVYDEFFEGKQKLTKTIKSFEARLESCRKYEDSLPDEELDIRQKLGSELDNVGLCLSADKTKPANLYFIREVDNKYGVKAKLYSIQRGTTGIVRFRKDVFTKNPFAEGDCLRLLDYDKSPRYTYRGGERAAIPGEYDIWAKKYQVDRAPNRN